MKILFVHKDINQDINAGGINTVYIEHIKKLERTNNKLFVITSRDGNWNLKAKRFVVSKDKNDRIKEIDKIIREIDPDIIDVFSWNAELLDYVKKPHRAKVIMRADIPMQYYGKNPIDEEMANYCDRIISISKWCDFEWSSKIGSNTTIIPHACSITAETNITKEKNSVVWVGKCTYIKGIDLILKLPKAFFDDFKLTIVCAPTRFNNEKILGALKEKGVIIKENLSDEEYRKLLQKSEFILSTARKEGFCISVLEGMRLGCIPVVPYWIGGTTDFVNNDNGIVYKNLRDCYTMMKALQNKEEVSKKAIDKSYEYNWNNIIEQSIKVYEELVDEY